MLLVSLFVVAEGLNFSCKQPNTCQRLGRMEDKVEYLCADGNVGHLVVLEFGKPDNYCAFNQSRSFAYVITFCRSAARMKRLLNIYDSWAFLSEPAEI